MSQNDTFARYPSLRDRSVLVTGGASGIGEALVEAFAMQQAKVAFIDVQETAGERLVARLAASGHPSVWFYKCDLTDLAALKETIDQIIADLGGVDVLINNAGNDTRHTIEEVTPEYWDKTMAVNLRHLFFTIQGVIPSMRLRGSGSIINMSSIGWIIPSTKLAVYVTAKAAIVGLTRTLAHELGADNIRVNSILPGAILTERQRQLWFTEEYKAEILGRQALKRLLAPQEVARLALFLAADDSSAMTNQSYVVDGGWI